jgi:hypothetical protein
MRLVLRTLVSAPLLQRQALLAYRPPIPHNSLWVRLPPALHRRACVTVYR